MVDDRPDTFLHYFELAELCMLPTIGGWTRKVAEIEQHISRGGKVNESGTFFVQASRSEDHAMHRVMDFFRAMPNDRRGSALIIAHYCPPRMVADSFPTLYYALHYYGVKPAGEDSWHWNHHTAGAMGSHVRWFWKRHKRLAPRRRKRD